MSTKGDRKGQKPADTRVKVELGSCPDPGPYPNTQPCGDALWQNMPDGPVVVQNMCYPFCEPGFLDQRSSLSRAELRALDIPEGCYFWQPCRPSHT